MKLTDWMSLVIRWELLEKGTSTCSVEGDTREELSFFDRSGHGSGEAQGGEMEESEGKCKALHGW